MQRDCLMNLCEHLSIPNVKIEDVTKDLWGEGRHTFRQVKLIHGKKKFLYVLMGAVNFEPGNILITWRYKV